MPAFLLSGHLAAWGLGCHLRPRRTSWPYGSALSPGHRCRGLQGLLEGCPDLAVGWEEWGARAVGPSAETAGWADFLGLLLVPQILQFGDPPENPLGGCVVGRGACPRVTSMWLCSPHPGAQAQGSQWWWNSERWAVAGGRGGGMWWGAEVGGCERAFPPGPVPQAGQPFYTWGQARRGSMFSCQGARPPQTEVGAAVAPGTPAQHQSSWPKGPTPLKCLSLLVPPPRLSLHLQRGS